MTEITEFEAKYVFPRNKREITNFLPKKSNRVDDILAAIFLVALIVVATVAIVVVSHAMHEPQLY